MTIKRWQLTIDPSFPCLLPGTGPLGGVEPEVTLSLTILFALGFLVYALNCVRTKAPLDIRLIALAAGCAALAVFVDAKLALGPMAGVCAWMGARKRPGSIVYFFHFLLVVGVLEAIPLHLLIPALPQGTINLPKQVYECRVVGSKL